MRYLFTNGIVEAFGCELNASLIDSWKTRLHQKQVIGQAELFPVWIAKLTWKNYLKDRRAIFFIDNDAARIGLIKAYSPVLPSLEIIMSVISLINHHNSSK